MLPHPPDAVTQPKAKAKVRRSKSTDFYVVDKPHEVEQQVWDDFIVLRKTKQAPITATALNGFVREAKEAGISLQEAIVVACEANWRGFNAVWYHNRVSQAQQDVSVVQHNVSKPISPKRMTAQERRFADADALIEKMLAREKTIDVQATEVKPPNFGNGAPMAFGE